MMIRSLAFAAACATLLPLSAYAGAKEDGEAVFNKFLTEFTAANVDGVVGLFWPDALFWGTTMVPPLAATPAAIRAYFTPGMGTRQPNERKAMAAGLSTVVVSDTVVLISGLWQTEQMVNGVPTRSAGSRVSVAVTKRGDRWAMAQFHNSAQPVPATAAAPTATPAAR